MLRCRDVAVVVVAYQHFLPSFRLSICSGQRMWRPTARIKTENKTIRTDSEIPIEASKNYEAQTWERLESED